MTVRILKGDCREILRTLPDESVHCVVTSPPYFGLRDYGVAGQIGLEVGPEAFVSEIVGVFREVRRVLRTDGTLWLNLGDTYASSAGQGPRGGPPSSSSTLEGNGHKGGGPKLARLSRVGLSGNKGSLASDAGTRAAAPGLKAKDLIGIPWRVAFALQADGWWLRQDIIWSKPNPMPESVTDRCTKAHEYLFLMTKSARYAFDAEAIKEDALTDDIRRPYGSPGANMLDGRPVPQGQGRPRKTWEERKASGEPTRRGDPAQSGHVTSTATLASGLGRNKRSVWTVTSEPFAEAHFATFPPALIEPCIKAGCPKGGIVLDPFGGAGTTGLVADRLGRNAILIELNPEYAAIAHRRITDDAGMFAEVTA
jgi:DNA modification methylase